MTLHTRGTRLYFATPLAPGHAGPGPIILRMRCPTAIHGIDEAAQDSALLDTLYPSKSVGADVGSDLTIPFNFNPRSRAHQALVQMRDARVQCSFLIAFGVDTPEPTTVTNGRLVSAGPLTAEFLGKVLVVSHQVDVGEITRSTLTITRDTATAWNFPAWTI